MKLSIKNKLFLVWYRRRNKHIRKCRRFSNGRWSCGHIEQYADCKCHVCAAYDQCFSRQSTRSMNYVDDNHLNNRNLLN